MSKSGWQLQTGELLKDYVSEDYLWSLFNFVFSSNSKKRSTYKFALIKAILDNLFNSQKENLSLFISYNDIFTKFTEGYWNLIVKYGIHQMRNSTSSTYTMIEQFFNEEIQNNPFEKELEFSSLSEESQNILVQKVSVDCKRNVVGALYNDFQGAVYSFNLHGEGLLFNVYAFNFMMKYKLELEKLNYYAWAKFIEQVNEESVLSKLINKLELSVPQRDNLFIFRTVLYKEFEENNCFYCGRKLTDKIHVDHFIPWSFIKEDKLWNFVLSCPTCNIKKSNRIPSQKYLTLLIARNKQLSKLQNRFVQEQFTYYNDVLLTEIWKYAQNGGIQIFGK
jgi:5-methylcytosine-specific restriction endonuclease McrA